MRRNTNRRAALCGGAALLMLSAGALGIALNGVKIVPKTGGERTAPVMVGAVRSSSLAPEDLYTLAVSQTFVVKFSLPLDTGGEASELGAGFAIDTDGYILTNCHVIADARDAEVPIIICDYDGNEYTAELIGADSVSDVALLKIDASLSSAAELGKSSEVKPCQQIYIVGHPEPELSFSVASGIVSGLNRSIDFADGTTLSMFQIDAPVNHGNSGGPVYNSRGEVIGMTTAKYQGLSAEGVGFALPIDDVIKIASELRRFGYVRGRPLLGVTVQATAADEESGSPAGVRVISVEEGLCCAKAGVRSGDIIIGLRGKPVTDVVTLTRAKLGYSAGDSAELKIWRDGEELTFIITFDEVTPEHPTGTVTLPVDEEGNPKAAESEPENR